jgi:hypothetical protein
MAGLAITLGIAILSGIGVGIILNWMRFINDLEVGDLFNDSAYWGQPSDYHHVVNTEANEEEMH